MPAAPSSLAAPAGRRFDTTDWALFLAISAIWGASFLLIDIGLDSLEPGVITLIRVGLGALVLNAIPHRRQRIDAGDRWRIAALSVIWVALPFTLFPLAEQHINSATTGLLNGATPIFTASIAIVFYKHRPSRLLLAGLVVGMLGVTLISLPSLGEGSSEAFGVVLVLIADLCYGVSQNLSAPIIRKYGSITTMSRVLALSVVWVIPFGLVGLADSRVEVAPLAAVSTLGLVGTGIAYLVMATLVGRVGAPRASFITYLIPVVSLVLGVAFRDDHVPGLALVGVVLVIAGALLASRSRT
jgi:drug/metabolite transporter (DMT)-like permease